MDVTFRLAVDSDIDRLLPMIRDFYEFERLPYDAALLRKLLSLLIVDDRLGRLIVFELQNDLIGYMVLGFGFSLEFHGRDCLIDEFYVRPEHRSRGIGAAAVEFASKLCRDLGIEAVRLEADHTNVRGHEFYKRLGFKDHPRHLMTRWL
jgi:GNAT superfamily N-acetyltransferase